MGFAIGFWYNLAVVVSSFLCNLTVGPDGPTLFYQENHSVLAYGFVTERRGYADNHVPVVFAPFELYLCRGPQQRDFAFGGGGEAVDGDLGGEGHIRVTGVAQIEGIGIADCPLIGSGKYCPEA